LCGEKEDDNAKWWIGDDRVTWKEVKSRHPTWTFQRHANTTFDKIMCWFFVKYNDDLAIEYNCKPSIKDELEKTGWREYDMNKILAEMRAELS